MTSKAFFDQVDDELRGLLGPSQRGFQSVRSSRLIKLWYEEPKVHFEAQRISERWSPGGQPAFEVGLHLEAPSAEENERVLEVLTELRRRWAKKFPAAESGPALGPMASSWRRVSEILPGPDLDDPDFASEIAERLALYTKTLRPLLVEALAPVRQDPSRPLLAAER